MKPFVWSDGNRWYVGARRHPGDLFGYWRSWDGFERAWFPTAGAAGDAVRAHLAAS